jgi:lipopolysaccharide/colanic/teichoic acid biosynthesis glycosyltransferase
MGDIVNEKLSLLAKRLVDIFFSAFGLVVLVPVFVVVSITIKLTMPGPIFFTQQRVGKDGVTFKIIKFRTMIVDKEIEQKVETQRIDSANDQARMTAAGRVLRRLKIDEIPQLINVFKGDMSLIGPRPTLERQVAKYNDYQKKRLLMKPGMSGLAQVNGGTSLTWDERIKYDIDYIENYSLWSDFLILMKTISTVLFGEERFKKGYKDFQG